MLALIVYVSLTFVSEGVSVPGRDGVGLALAIAILSVDDLYLVKHRIDGVCLSFGHPARLEENRDVILRAVVVDDGKLKPFGVLALHRLGLDLLRAMEIQAHVAHDGSRRVTLCRRYGL